MGTVREVSDLANLRAQIKDLEARSGEPDLWDDPEHAQAVTSQ